MATTISTPFATIRRDASILGAGLATAWHWVGRRWMRNRTEAALGGLSNAILHDIGIERSQIPAIARELAANAGVRPGARAPAPCSGRNAALQQ